MSWIYKDKNITSLKEIPNKVIGFIYEITDEKGKKYIGKKSLFHKRNVKISENNYKKKKNLGYDVHKKKNKKKSKKGKPVWNYYIEQIKESNWFNYTGSCNELNDNIKKGLKVRKEILEYCYSKKQLTYYEIKQQICRGVLENNEQFYNKNIMGRFFPADLK